MIFLVQGSRVDSLSTCKMLILSCCGPWLTSWTIPIGGGTPWLSGEVPSAEARLVRV